MGTYSPRTWLIFINQENEEITEKKNDLYKTY